MPIQCQNCKNSNKDTASFCTTCGTNLVISPESLKPIQTSIDPGRQSETVFLQSSFSPSAPPIRSPKLRGGPSRTVWVGYIIYATVILFSIAGEREPDVPVMIGFFLISGLMIVLIFFWQSIYMSIVTNLRKEYGYWLFDLRRTDEAWQPLKDRKGFSLPIIEVLFRPDRVHGARLEEGSRITLRGKKKKTRIHGKEIWNLTTDSTIGSVYGEQQIFQGRVINWDSPRQVPDTRYPNQNKFIEVWSFRLQRINAQGQFSSPLPVEIRAQSIGGTLRDGDQIEIYGNLVNGIIYAKEIKNHSVSALLRVRVGLDYLHSG